MLACGRLRATARARVATARDWLDVHPRAKLGYLIGVYAPIAAIVAAAGQLPSLLLARKSFFLLTVLGAVRVSTSWFSTVFSFFYFVQLNVVGRLRGEGRLEEAGRLINFAMSAALGCGVFVAAITCAVAEPLLRLTSPLYEAETVALGLSAAYATSVGLAAIVVGSPLLGGLLALHEYWRTVASAICWAVLFGVVALAMLELMVDCSTKPAAVGPTYLCPGSVEFLTAVTALSSWFLWAAAAQLSWLLYTRARAMGLYPRGMLAKRLAGAGADDVALRAAWGRDSAAVAVRSVLNNSREFVTLFLALRMGTNAGAVVTVFGSVSALASGVPAGVSTAMMSEGSRQLGLGRHAVVLWYLRAFHGFGLGCGCVFALILSQQRGAVVATYSGSTEYAGFAELTAEAWPIFVAYQPVLALVSVLGPMVAATQHYAYWGGSVTVCFMLVFLPLTVYAAHSGSVYLLLLAELLYNAAQVCALAYKVTYCEMSRLAKLARSDVAAASDGSMRL